MDTNQVAAPALPDQLPEHAAHLAGEPELVAAWTLEITERRSQAAKVEALLAYKTRKLERNKAQHAFTRRALEKAITRDAATVLGLTESAVRRLLGTAEFLTEKLPKTWNTYQTGLIDRASAAKAAVAVEDIAHRQDLLPVIDAEIAERAPRDNAGAVQKWVPQRVAELDTASFHERYDRAQQKRYVNFHHLGNGMSRIEALIPTLVAAQLEQQIYTQARNAPRTLPPGGTGNEPSEESPALERTLSQRIADAFISRLHTGSEEADSPENGAGAAVRGSGTTGAISGDPELTGSGAAGQRDMKIGILVPVQTLIGEAEASAISWDRSWSLPAGTARQIALDPTAQHDWYIAGTVAPADTARDTARDTAHPAAASGIPITTSQPLLADAALEILTVVHPRKGPGDRPLGDWIRGADPQAGNLLARTYQTRTARDRQRDAVLIRDGQCTHTGCTKPGWQAEIDHTQSFETGGHTTGENLKVLCRDCHSIKSHRLDHSPRASSNGGTDRRPSSSIPARASPTEDDLPEWLTETRPPPDWVTEGAASTARLPE